MDIPWKTGCYNGDNDSFITSTGVVSNCTVFKLSFQYVEKISPYFTISETVTNEKQPPFHRQLVGSGLV